MARNGKMGLREPVGLPNESFCAKEVQADCTADEIKHSISLPKRQDIAPLGAEPVEGERRRRPLMRRLVRQPTIVSRAAIA
jgi:hypothetical protein